MKKYNEYIKETTENYKLFNENINKKLKNSDILEKIDKSLLNFIRQFIPNDMEVSILLFRENLTDYCIDKIMIQYLPKNNENNIKSSFLPKNIKNKLIEKYPSLHIKGTQNTNNDKYTYLEGDLRLLYKPICIEIDKYNL